MSRPIWNRIASVSILIVAVFGLASPAGAGTDTWMSLRYQDFPTEPIRLQVSGLEDLKLYSTELGYRIGVKWDVGDRGSWAKTRFLYGWFVVDFGPIETLPDSLPRFDKVIYSILELTYRGRYDGPWGWQARIAPGAGFAQFKDFSEREFQIEGGLWGLYRFTNGDVGAGVIRTLAFGEPMFLPSIIAEYDDGETWRVEAELPLLLAVEYRWKHGFDFGFTGEIQGYRYALEENELVGTVNPYLLHSVRTAAGTISYRFDSQLYLRFMGGYSFNRMLRYQDDTGILVNLDMENGWYYSWFIEWGGG